MGHIWLVVLVLSLFASSVSLAETNDRPTNGDNRCRTNRPSTHLYRLNTESSVVQRNVPSIQADEARVPAPKHHTLVDTLHQPGWWWHVLGARHMPTPLQRMWIKPDIDLATNYYGVMMGGVRF